ncbi:manganase accumulation protein MntS [Cronobacter dublinensis]
MNEVMRCMRVFTHSPFQVRLRLLNMLCDMFNSKSQPGQDDLGQK